MKISLRREKIKGLRQLLLQRLDHMPCAGLYSSIMNWDWEKLQDKRQRQPRGNGNNSPLPPNLGDLGNRFKNFKGFSFPAYKIAFVVAALIWAGSGIFIVSPDEEGVILRFGKFSRAVEPGPHYRLPFPIEEHMTPKVKEVQRVEIGFRSLSAGANVQGSKVRLIPEEAAMLTSDENIVTVQFIVQYQIKNSQDFLFNIARQAEAVKSAAEASMREVIGRSQIDAALTEGKMQIQSEAQTLLQNILDRYSAGIRILTVQMQDVHAPLEVMGAFKDVASAREDKSKTINEAEAYANKIIPEARGVAAEILNQAEAYKETAIRKADGESQRFLALAAEYGKAKDVTRRRMYIEAMEEILSAQGMEKLLLSKDAGSKMLPILPLSPGSISGQTKGGNQ